MRGPAGPEKLTPRQAPARPDVVLQRRGVQRVQAILDAAEAILGEQGYEAATLKAIGERSGIPTASLYHYFSDRFQVDVELLGRYLSELDPLVTATFDDPAVSTLELVVDAVVDAMLTYFREHPACAVLWFSGRSEPVEELVRAFDAAAAERLWRIAVDRGLLHPDTSLRVVRLAFEAGNRLFDVAFRDSPGGDDATIDELRRMSVAYLRTYA